MPPRKQEDPEIVLTRAQAKLDVVLESIKRMHATALEALSDIDKVPLIAQAEELNNLVKQFQNQQDFIIDALLGVDRMNYSEFEQDDHPVVTSMRIPCVSK